MFDESTAYAFSNQGEYLCRLGRFREAREPAARALAIFERETGPASGLVAYPLLTLGLSHLGTDEPAQAIPLLERAAHIREASETPAASYVFAFSVNASSLRPASGADTARHTKSSAFSSGRPCGPSGTKRTRVSP